MQEPDPAIVSAYEESELKRFAELVGGKFHAGRRRGAVRHVMIDGYKVTLKATFDGNNVWKRNLWNVEFPKPGIGGCHTHHLDHLLDWIGKKNVADSIRAAGGMHGAAAAYGMGF